MFIVLLIRLLIPLVVSMYLHGYFAALGEFLKLLVYKEV